MMKLLMKKLILLTASLAYLAISQPVFAETINIIQPRTSSGQQIGYTNVSDFLNAAIRLVFIVALLIALVMLLWGAVEWILSGGNKDAVGNARGRIIHALVGLAILAVAFAIISLAGSFLGVPLLNFTIPTPTTSTGGI